MCALPLAAQNTTNLSTDKPLQTAQTALDSLDYETAIQLGKELLVTYKKDNQVLPFIQTNFLLGDAYREQGDYDTALIYYHTAKERSIQHYVTKSADIAQANNDIGLCYWKKGALPEATQAFEDALRMRIALFGETHPKVADSYNNLGNCAFDQRDLNTARTYYEEALNIRLESLESNDPDIASSYNNLGTVYRFAGRYEDAVNYYTKSITIREKQLGLTHPKVAQSCNNLGQCYEQMGETDTAIPYFDRSVTILQQHFEAMHPDFTTAYLGLGNAYAKAANHNLALRYFEKALEVQSANFDSDSPNLISVYNNLANAYKNLGDYKKSMLYYENNLHILGQTLGASHPFTAATHNNIGLIQVELMQFEEALKNYRQALSIYEAQNNLPLIADTWNNIGSCLRQQIKFPQAIEAYEQSKTIYQKLDGNRNNNLATISYNIGNCLGEEKAFPRAITYYNQAIDLVEKSANSSAATLAIYKTSIGTIYYKEGRYEAALVPLNEALNLLDLAIIDSSKAVQIASPIAAINLLNTKVKTLYALAIKKKSATELEEIIQLTDFSIQIINELRQQYQEDYSKRKLSETVYSTFYLGIAACQKLYQSSQEERYIKKAFLYSEKSRSNSILEALVNHQSAALANIPDSLLAKEEDLKSKIALLEKQQDQSTIAEYKNELFEQKEAYNQLIQRFETEFPTYYQLKYDHSIISVEEVQEKLADDEALIEYFVQDTTVFIFLINQKGIHLETVYVDSLLKEVELFSAGIYIYYLNVKRQTEKDYLYYVIQYMRTANFLYQKLIEPIADRLPEKITIVNGGVLNYLPFDAFISDLPEGQVHRLRDIAYLIKQHEINYAYSATAAYALKERLAKKPNKKLLAFAPTFTIPNRLGLAPLSHTSKEVQLIQQLVPNSDLWIGDRATKTQFINLAGRYQILHLATHGKSDSDLGDNSYLVFTDNITADTAAALLYAKDIYNLSIPAELVFLSACETGKGELAQGEGVYSLARAFFYAGAASVVTTLWSINDATTKHLVQSFYQNLHNGFSKGAALRQAKLEYIQEADDPNPFFWAAFTLTGDTGHIDLVPPSFWKVFISFLVIVFGLLWLIYLLEKMVGKD